MVKSEGSGARKLGFEFWFQQFLTQRALAGHCLPTPPLKTPGHSQASLAQSLVGLLLLSSGFLVHTRFCVYPPRICFPSPVQVLSSNPTGLQSQIPWDSQSVCQIPRLGTLLWTLELSQQCKNFFGIIVLQFVVCLLGGFMLGLNHHASQVCFSHSTCPRSRPLLTRAFTGDTHTLKGRSGSASCGVPGSWCTQGFV